MSVVTFESHRRAKAIRTVVVAGIATLVICGQAAPFQNLGFDAPNHFQTDALGFGFGNTSDVLPGWQLYHGGAPQTIVGFNCTYVFMDDLTNVTLNDQAHAPLGFVEGLYTFTASARTSDSFTLVQRGDVPADMPLITIKKFGRWELRINDEPVKIALESPPADSFPWTVAVFDISRYAGQEVEMRWTTQSSGNILYPFDGYLLDSIQFVKEVPEPPPAAFLVLALATLFVSPSRFAFQRVIGTSSRGDTKGNTFTGAIT